jgi:hypothetical protein
MILWHPSTSMVIWLLVRLYGFYMVSIATPSPTQSLYGFYDVSFYGFYGVSLCMVSFHGFDGVFLSFQERFSLFSVASLYSFYGVSLWFLWLGYMVSIASL